MSSPNPFQAKLGEHLVLVHPARACRVGNPGIRLELVATAFSSTKSFGMVSHLAPCGVCSALCADSRANRFITAPGDLDKKLVYSVQKVSPGLIVAFFIKESIQLIHRI